MRLSTPWERKLELLDQMADVFDATMVADGIIQPHPKFNGSATSGYRLMEHAYAEIIKGCRTRSRRSCPCGIKSTWSRFHSGYVNSPGHADVG